MVTSSELPLGELSRLSLLPAPPRLGATATAVAGHHASGHPGGGSNGNADDAGGDCGGGSLDVDAGVECEPSHTPTGDRSKGSVWQPPARVRYTAFLLDDVSRCSLLDLMRELGAESPRDWTATCDHLTICHAPSDAHLADFPFGIPCQMAVLGVAGDDRARAVHVDVPDFVPQPSSAVRPATGMGKESRRESGKALHFFLPSVREPNLCLPAGMPVPQP